MSTAKALPGDPVRLTFFNLDRYSHGVTQPPRDKRIPDLVSLDEAAKMLKVSRQYAHRLVTSGTLRGARIGGTWVFRRSAVDKLHQQREQAKKTQ